MNSRRFTASASRALKRKDSTPGKRLLRCGILISPTTAWGQERTWRHLSRMSASLIGHSGSSAFRLSTTTVSMSLTGSCFSSESAPGGPSIMGFEDEAEQSLPRPCREIRPTQADMRTHLIHRPARDIMPRLGGDSIFLLLDLILHGFHAAAAACSRVQWNSVPSTHMRCMITANRRARASIAFFIPLRLAICIAQALCQDHFFDRSML